MEDDGTITGLHPDHQNTISLHEPTTQGIFSGDTNPSFDIPRLRRSIQTHLLTLPDDTTTYPGHGVSTTIGHERRHNRAARPR